MATKPTPKKAHYRRVDISTPDGPATKTLFQLMQEALASPNVPTPVQKPLSASGKAYQLMVTRPEKQPYYREGCLCGTLLVRDEEKTPSSVSVHGKAFDQGNYPIKDDQGNVRQLEEDHIHFAIQDNHIAIIGHRGWKADFELFLLWLINDTGVSERTSFTLQNVPTKEARKKAKGKPVKKVAFSAVRQKEQIVVEGKRKGTTKKVSVYREAGWTRKLMQLIASDDPLFQKKVASADLSTVGSKLEFFFRALAAEGNETRNTIGQELVNDIAAHLGGHDDIEPTIDLVGATIKGDELTIAEEINVQVRDGNISQDSAWTELAKWLTGLITDDKI